MQDRARGGVTGDTSRCDVAEERTDAPLRVDVRGERGGPTARFEVVDRCLQRCLDTAGLSIEIPCHKTGEATEECKTADMDGDQCRSETDHSAKSRDERFEHDRANGSDRDQSDDGLRVTDGVDRDDCCDDDDRKSP